MRNRRQLLEDHNGKTAELTAALRELGDMKARVIQDSAHAWLAGYDSGVTERREGVKAAVASIEAEVQNQVAEVEALRAELADIALQLRYGEFSAQV